MATRRHRLVIKPNIRPVAAKTGGATTPKPKPSSANVAVEPPSPAARTQLATPSVEENSQQSADEEEKKVENLSDADLCQASLKPAVDITDDDVQPGATSGDVESEQKASSTAKEASGAHKEREVSLSKKEKAFASTNDVNNDDLSGNCPSNLVDTTSISVRPHAGQQSRNPKSSTPDVDNQALKSKDQTDSAEVVKNTEADDDAASPSETDSSSMLETVSLDLDDDRREETGDRSLKNRRWHKTKKTRTEPLPSREKSPDRQKMKMSDLLSWNPQQNFLPKKNKKKAVLKNENHLESPVSSPAEDNDKESTNQSGSLPAPQIMIGPDGNIVLDTESLLIHAPKDDNKPKEVLEDDDDDRYLNTNTYRQYRKPKQWTERETEKFFIGLSMCGTDFSLLTNLLPHRSRRELKNKFHREERRNRDLIDKALSNRQQYDLAPFEKMTAEDEKKMKKEMKKHIKKENRAAEKSEKSSRKRGRKRKNKESEDEEDNWGPEYDEENEENQDNEEVSQGAAQAAVVKQKQRTPKLKKELDRPKQSEQNASGVFPENPGMPFLPGYCKKSATDGLESIAPEVPQYAGYSDLDNPKMRNKPTKTYSRLATQERANQAHVTSTANMGANFQTSSAIQAIPGSNQVQIEMEGVQNPVQGVLIPSHMVPLIAPQLGIQGNPFGIQVLLVQEETESGSLVHVYVIPEGDTSSASCNSADAGVSRSNSHPAFSSPVQSPHHASSAQSPHHASSAQSPHQTLPFTVPCNPHPLASAFSPPLHSSVQIRSPVSEPQTADHAQRLHFQAHTSPPHQNLHPVPSQGFSGPPSSCSGNNIEIIVTQPPVNTESYIPVGLLENTVAAAQETTANNKRKITCGPGSRSAQPQPVITCTTAQTRSPKSLYRSAATADSVCAQSLHSLESRASFPSVAQNNDLSNARTKEVLDCEMSTANSSRADSDEEDDDCVILDSDKPQSQPDRAALSCT